MPLSLLSMNQDKSMSRCRTRTKRHDEKSFFSFPLKLSTSEHNNEVEKQEKEDMIKSIEAMRQEARKRLEALSKDMSEYKVQLATTESEKQLAWKPESKEKEYAPTSTISAQLVHSSTDDLEETMDWKNHHAHQTVDEKSSNLVSNDQLQSKLDSPTLTTTIADSDLIPIQHADPNRLVDTRWKIVYDLGREPGTWMPKTWGASGDRLRFSVVVDMTGDPYYEKEEFFDGIAGAKILRVVEAVVIPSFWGRQSHGQESLQVNPIGAYKVMKGAGPMGTDTLRFFIETQQEVFLSDNSDVSCPKGRIYGNCGYFPIHSTVEGGARQIPWKDVLQKEYAGVAARYEQLQIESEEDTRVFSLDHLSRMKQILDTRATLKRLEQRIQEARQREPEKSQLRLSRRGDVGLSKEGGVCLKVQKGLAVEYHILGRMELACMQKEIPKNHEDYDDLVHKLHP